ncbi:MAG: hypothetical protein PSV22_15035 [Pseudolabrys sp.]|nr:hypothetical protein [Pseudolabrys sp.]
MGKLSHTESAQLWERPDFTKIAVVGLVAIAFYKWIESAERRYNRGLLLAAYRRRRDWKKSDVAHLQSLGVNKAARSRMARLVGRGRPVVRPHQRLDELIVSKFGAFAVVVDNSASSDDRRKAFKELPWWPHYVEALYRGEHEAAKARGLKGASSEAEIAVGNALGISAATVHSLSGEIRSLRKEIESSANFPAMTLVEYECLMRNGFGHELKALAETSRRQ